VADGLGAWDHRRVRPGRAAEVGYCDTPGAAYGIEVVGSLA